MDHEGHGSVFIYGSDAGSWVTKCDPLSALVRSIKRNVMLLQQFLPAIPQISSEFSVFQQDSAPTHRALEAINFSQ